MTKVRKHRPSPALVISIVALLTATLGTAYAASQLPKNSVSTKQIKKGAVTGIKIKKGTITGKNINLAKLGTVPSATNATTAATANSLASLEAVHLVGASGQPPFLDGSKNEPGGVVGFPPVGFYKDHEGIVHLEGAAAIGPEENPVKGLIFSLPPGFRPASGIINPFPQVEDAIFVSGSNVSIAGKNLEGDVLYTKGAGIALLSGITFRAQS